MYGEILSYMWEKAGEGMNLCRIIIKLCNAYLECTDVSPKERKRMKSFRDKYLKLLEG